jgi:anti-sigma factor RsiW
MLNRHLNYGQLLDLEEGRLTASTAVPLHEHLAQCAACAERLATIQRTIAALHDDAGEDAPAYVIARAKRLLPQFRTQQAEPSPLRRVLAALNFDSFSVQPAYGLRSGQTTARQMLFNADDHDLDLRITPAGEQWVVAGQVLGPSTGGTVTLDGPTTVETPLNDLSEFTLPPVPAGSYSLNITLEGTTIAIDGLELGR